MSGSGRKRVSKWDTKGEETQHLSGSDYVGKSGSYFREKDPEHARFYPEGRNGSRRSAPDDDSEHLISRQHSGEAWPSRSRVSHDEGDEMMGYYDSRKSSEQEESRQQYFRQSPSRDRPKTRRSGSRSYSRSRSRSPVQRVRRDAGGSYDRHKPRTRVSPRPGREADGRYSRAGDYDWEGQNRKTRDTKYYTEDSREQFPVRVGGGRSDYSSDFQEDNKNDSRRDTADPILRSHRNEYSRDREMQRRDVPEGEFHRSSNIPCKFFASGYCRNGNSCRFSHHGPPPTRGSPERKPQDEMFSRQDNNHSGTTERMRNSHRWNDIEKSETGKSSDNHSRTTERMRNSHRWNDIENSETGKSSEVEMSRVSTVMSEAKVNNGSWIGDMEMSPDWNYGVKTRKKPVNEEHGFISQSSQSLVPKDVVAPSYEHGAATISQQDGNQRSIGMFSTVGEKAVASSHHNFSNNLVTVAPPVQTFNQNIENQSAVPYQSTPVAVGGSQVLLPGATNLSAGLNSSNPGNGNAQNTVSREELNHIGNISASLVQFLKNGQLIPQLPSTLNPKQEMQVPEVYVEKEQASHAQSDLLGNDSIIPGGIPAVTALPINNMDSHQVRLPDNVVPLDGNPKASSVDNQDKKTDEEATKEPDGKKIGEEEDIEDAENVAEEEDDGMGDENNKKEKDPKGMRAFKFALVEIIKELLKPAWKEGGMNKDAYKNIVKKVVDKVTGAIQTGNIPQTQEKIDHYLSASKPKLTKLVQAYISKVKKS